MFESDLHTLAVVPIVVNAGTALLPAIVAGVVSVLGVLFRPDQWKRVMREKPWVPIVVTVCVALSLGGWFFFSGAETAARAATPRGAPVGLTTSTGLDWSAIAREYVRDQHRRALEAQTKATTPGGGASVKTPAASRLQQPFVFRANMERSGSLDPSGPTQLKERWTWRDPEDPFAMYLSSLATDGVNLYGASASLVPPDTFGAVFCLDASTGQLKWIVSESPSGPFKGIFSSPALTADGKYLVIGEGLHADKDSAMLCFEAATGKLLWRIETTQHLESSPAIEGDLVVIGAGAIERMQDKKVPPGGDPGFVLAVHISTGKEAWRYPVNDPESSPALVDGICYIGSGVNGNAVVALRTDSDEQLKANGQDRLIWRTPTPFPALAAVTVVGDLVLVGCGDGDFIRSGPNGVVMALDRKTGEVKWQTDAKSIKASVLSPVAVGGNVAVVGVGNGSVVALDLQTGKALWAQQISQAAPVNAGCAVTDNHVYALSADGWLAVLDKSDGKLIEKHFLNDKSRPGELGMTVSAPVIVDGRVYAGSETCGIHDLQGAQ